MCITDLFYNESVSLIGFPINKCKCYKDKDSYNYLSVKEKVSEWIWIIKH